MFAIDLAHLLFFATALPTLAVLIMELLGDAGTPFRTGGRRV